MAAATLGSALISRKGSKGSRIQPELFQEPEEYQNIRKALGEHLLGRIGKREPYTGELVAPLSDIENLGLERLKQFGTAAPPAVLGEGTEEVRKTLASGYDPETSAYYQAFRQKRLAELDESTKRLREEAAGAGRFFHGGRLESTRRLEEGALRDINLQSATLGERERERKLQVLPYALRFAETSQDMPLQQIEALMQYGAVPRGIEQGKRTGLYNEFIRQLGQEGEDVDRAARFVGPLPITYPSYAPSQLPQMLQGAGSVLGSIPW